jgi:hypothetical protein
MQSISKSRSSTGRPASAMRRKQAAFDDPAPRPGLDLYMDEEKLRAPRPQGETGEKVRLTLLTGPGEELLVQEDQAPEVETPRRRRQHEPEQVREEGPEEALEERVVIWHRAPGEGAQVGTRFPLPC